MADRIGNTIAEAYVIGDTTKKYYKWVPWEQPVMTSNTMYGNLKGSSQHAVSKVGTRYYYRMFDKDTTTTDGRINHWSPSNVVTAWWCWELPVQLKITKITVHGDKHYDSAAAWHVIGQFYTDATKRTKVGEELVIDGKGQVKEIVIPDGIIVTALYFDKTGGGAYGGIDQIDIEATTPVEVAPGEDYDFTNDQPVIKLPVYKPKRKYYKRVFRPWNYTPALTSNTSDPNFIVSASSYLNGDYAVWKSFAATRNTTYPWISHETKTGWYQIKTTSKLRINRIHILNRSYNADTGSLNTFVLKGSLDGVTWEDIGTFTNSQSAKASTYWVEVNSKKAYYYHKFDILASNQTVTWCSLGFPTIYADEEYSKYEVSSDDDWDFYEDEQEVLQAATYVHKRYFKRGTEPNLNMQVLGTTTIDNGVLNNINAAARLIIDRIPKQVSSYEMQFKVNFGVFNAGRIIGNYKTNICCPQIEGPADATQAGVNALRLAHSNAAGSWVTLDTDTYLFELGKDYWIRAIWNGQLISVDVSENGRDFIRTKSVFVDTCKWTEQAMIGVDVDAYATGTGTKIDLKESYIKINGEMWWRGTRPVECSKEEAEWSEWININKPIN